MLELLYREHTRAAARLGVAVQAGDPVRAAALGALVAATGNDVVAHDQADLLLTDAVRGGALPELVLSDAGQDGAVSALPSSIGVAALGAALRAVAAGLIVHAPGARPAGRPAPPRVPLTPRELDILGCLGDGLSNKAAARRLGISQHTIKFHLEAVFAKLAVRSRAEAVAKGLRSGLLGI